METAKHQAREAQQEIRELKARLARTLGEEVAVEHPEHSVPSATVRDLHAQVEQLLAAQDDLRGQLRDTEKSSKRPGAEPHAHPRAQLQLEPDERVRGWLGLDRAAGGRTRERRTPTAHTSIIGPNSTIAYCIGARLHGATPAHARRPPTQRVHQHGSTDVG